MHRNGLICREVKDETDRPEPDTLICSDATSFLQPQSDVKLNDTAKEYLASFKQFETKPMRPNVRSKQKSKPAKKDNEQETRVSDHETVSSIEESSVGRRLRERANRNIQKVKYTRGFVEVNGLKTLPESNLNEYIETLTCNVMAPAESVKLNRRHATMSKPTVFEPLETKSGRSPSSHPRPVATAS